MARRRTSPSKRSLTRKSSKSELDESAPVSVDEEVYRRIPANSDYYVPSLPVPIQRVAFRPNERDVDGLSVFRTSFVSAQELANSGRKPGNYYITQLSVRAIVDLGLTLVPDPQEDQLPGHCLIPELSFDAAEQDKNRSKEIQRELAKIASKYVVHSPGDT